MTRTPAIPVGELSPASLAGGEIADFLQRFPPRTRPPSWPATAASMNDVLDALRQPPLKATPDRTQDSRLIGARAVLRWLETFPGATWQQRWEASPAPASPNGWVLRHKEWARATGRSPSDGTVQAGMLALLSADVIRPDMPWLVSNPSRFLRPTVQAARDPEGFARLETAGPNADQQGRIASEARKAIAQILVAYGGKIQDITVGDCLARLQACGAESRGIRLAYVWLRELGHFPPDAPATLLTLVNRSGQVGPAGLVDRYHLRCEPVRNLIVDYLTERQPSLDYSSLRSLSTVLASNFWADLERHHPGIDSLRLSVEISTAWKARLASKTIRKRQPNGVVAQVTEPRARSSMIKQGVRAFYLDIAHWALDEPERWGLWAAPSPISEGECSHKKAEQQQKSWADQRTRERLPVLPALVRAVDRQLKEARARLDALNATPLGTAFTVLDDTFTVPLSTQRSDGRPRTAIDAHGQRRDFGTEEKSAFWGWATIEILRHTGIRIEELRELGHHSIISYRLPSTGDTVPLLQIAPSKTDQERLLLVTPELADVLSAVVSRVRNESGVIPSISSYDQHERKWNPPMPLLYQWRVTGEDRRISETTIRHSINGALEASGLVDNSGNPLRFMPHDFRRIFITDAILNGLPPHIAQVVAGHANINTTMGYAAIYPVEAIEAHRSFIARRRSLRPSEEYRAVTPEEWQDFLGHFERRKLALGECGRAYGTDCNHEHACVRCPVLVMSASDRPRLVEIRDNLRKRITEAESEGWLGEVEGLSVSLDAADQKISQLDERDSRKTSPVFIGVPVFEQITGRSINNEEPTR